MAHLGEMRKSKKEQKNPNVSVNVSVKFTIFAERLKCYGNDI